MNRFKEIIPPAAVAPAAATPTDQQFTVIEVCDVVSERMFVTLPYSIYRDDPHWIPPVEAEIRHVFDPAANPYYKHGAACRWIVVNNANQVLGRIAAFVNYEKMHDDGHVVGSMGFFECVNMAPVAFRLFDTAVKWLTDHFKVTAVDGPVNFGENDKYWGLLVKGFMPPSYGMNYNPAYYQDFFEDYGFKPLFRQFTNCVDLQKPLPERFMKIASRVNARHRFSFEPFRYRERDRFINDFIAVYNQAWASFKNFQPIEEQVIKKTLDEIRFIMEEDFIWFAYADGKPAGFIFAVPDVNGVLKYSGVRFNLWGKLKFLFYRYTKGFSRVRVVVMGIAPEFQQRGLESGLITHAYREGEKRRRYKHVELSWVGDFNDKMIAIHKAMGAVEEKQHVTYRKIL